MNSRTIQTFIAFLVVLTFLPIHTYAEDDPQIHISGFHFDDEIPYYNRRLSSFVDENIGQVKNNDLIIGHSMGGLIAMGILNSLDETIKPSGVITVDSPVAGWAGLDYGFDRVKANLVGVTAIHSRAISACVSACLPVESCNQVLALVLPDYVAIGGTWLLGIILDACDVTGLLSAIMNTTGNSSKALLIKDMGRASEYVRNNVQEYKEWYEKEVVNTIPWIGFEWRKKKIGWVYIAYLAVVSIEIPIYGDVKKTSVERKHRTDVPIGHVVGTDNDPLNMADDRRFIQNFLNGFGTAYTLGAGANTVWAIATAPLGSVFYGWQALQAANGAAWCFNYKDRWGDIIGGRQSDGFITTATQRTYYNTNDPEGVDYFRTIKIDHARSTPSSSSTDPLNYQVWGPEGLVDQIAKNMGAKYIPVRK